MNSHRKELNSSSQYKTALSREKTLFSSDDEELLTPEYSSLKIRIPKISKELEINSYIH